jgi:hypothetical protein
MPNSCRVEGVIYGDQKLLVQLEQAFRDGNPFQTFLPIDEAALGGDSNAIVDARYNLWGTKWDLEDSVDHAEVKDDCLVVAFITAWEPPVGFFRKLTELGLEIYFTFGAQDEFFGVYENGLLIDSRHENLSEEDRITVQGAKESIMTYFESDEDGEYLDEDEDDDDEEDDDDDDDLDEQDDDDE